MLRKSFFVITAHIDVGSDIRRMTMSTSKTENEKGNWLDFETIKANADVTAVLTYYGLIVRLEQRTNEFVGWCPMGTKKHGKKDSFNFNVQKKTFKCFACKQHGSTLDFVAKYQNLHLREAAEVLVMIHDGTAPEAPPPREDSEELPNSIMEPASEESEQTRGKPKLAEIEGSAMQSPSVDDPATVYTETTLPSVTLANYVFSLDDALSQVTSGKKIASQFIVIDKDFLNILARF